MTNHRMSLFKDVLKADETLFKNVQVLEFDYHPKLIKHREGQQFAIAGCIKPLFVGRKGENVLVFGSSGICKTLACQSVLQELEEETYTIVPLYVNCWQHNTTYKVALNICEQLNYPFTPNKKGIELFKEIANLLNHKGLVLVFDEIDKTEDIDFLYTIIENIFKHSIILITNNNEKLFEMDKRVRSRLILELIEFRKYSLEETRDILKERIKYAFHPNVWEIDAINSAVKHTHKLGDIRSGLIILQKAGKLAENQGSRKIKLDHVESVLDKVDKYTVRGSSDLDGETRDILQLIKENCGKTIVDCFKIYKETGRLCYRSFYRKVKYLELNKYVAIHKMFRGRNGNTSTVEYLG